MSGYAGQNSKAFRDGLTNYSARVVKPKVSDMLRRVAEEMVKVIDGSFKFPHGTKAFPVYTGNLHDATGVGVYMDGSIQYFVPTVKASGPQSTKSGESIEGSALLRQAIANASTRFSKGIWIVLFSSVPYAYKVDTSGSKLGRGVGFFENLEEDLVDIFRNLEVMTA